MPWTPDWTWFGPILGAVAAFATVYGTRYQLRAADFERRLRGAQDEIVSVKSDHQRDLSIARPFISSTSYSDYISNDIFILGPQTAGKTALVKYWTKYWQIHLGLTSTPSFEMNYYIFPDSFKLESYRQILGVDVSCNVHAKLNIWDYGGEVHLIEDAVKNISKLDRVTLIFVISSEPEHTRRNLEYYSTSFTHRMDRMLHDKNNKSNLLKVIVLFSKIDLLMPNERSVEVLEKRYEECLHKLRLTFDNVGVYALSGESGEGIIPFLQEVSSIYVDEEGISKFRDTVKVQ